MGSQLALQDYGKYTKTFCNSVELLENARSQMTLVWHTRTYTVLQE